MAGSNLFVAAHAWPRWLSLVVWLGLIAYIGALVVLGARAKRQIAGPDILTGWPNRLMVTTYIVWLVIASWTILQR